MILKLDHIYKDYIQGKMVVPVLKDVSLHVEEGEYVAIMGPSGSGKSTLMNIVGCLDRPTSGSYELAGENVLNRNDKDMAYIRLNNLGFVFQNFQLLPRQSALENVCLPLIYAGVKKKERVKRAEEALGRVGLEDRMYFKPTQLSGGQKQRVAIAGIIAMRPKCIVLDEPTAMLDPQGRREVLRTIRELGNRFGITVVLITHYMDEAAQCDRVVVMDNGKIILDGVPRAVFSHVEQLKNVGLDVPQVTELAWLLLQDGYCLPDDIIFEEECVQAIEKLLEERHVSH